jgi:threonylcarbamoyladenosine tRNA methylthiotransferase MtaB
MDWSQDLFELLASEPRIAQHVHLPLQSGSDSVLKRMFRKYRTRHYASRIAIAHALMPDAAIGADVMTGFPGETDAEFAETCAFIESLPFTYLHVFTYSERPGTPASLEPSRECNERYSMPARSDFGGPVPIPVRQERTRILREISDKKNLEFRRRMLGKTLSAVTLEQKGMAMTSNFLKVEMAREREPNQIIALPIGAVTAAGLKEHSPFMVL